MENFNAEYIVVRYGELSTKGKNRKDFVKYLADQIHYRLIDIKGIKIQKTYSRIIIHLNGVSEDEIVLRLATVFGISSYSVAIRCSLDLTEITQAAVSLMKIEMPTTFKVETRRQDKNYPFMSDDVNRAVATEILEQTEHKVDVHKPEIRVKVEIQSDKSYIMTKSYPGAQGYPVGVAGKMMVMLSGGIDSPVAAYLTMKRGAEIECIHFAAPPYTSQQAQQKVIQLAEILSAYQGRIKVHVVPFTALQMEIYQKANPSYAITLMRRMMYRIAERIAQKNNCLAISNGESMGQVASQTLQSMQVIGEVITMLVLRPVVSYDKLEIIDLANKIQTYETSIQPYEDCCTIFTVTNPVTKPKHDWVLMEENKLDYIDLLETVVNDTVTLIVSEREKRSDYL